jgi:hypothetical protein
MRWTLVILALVILAFLAWSLYSYVSGGSADERIGAVGPLLIAVVLGIIWWALFFIHVI